MSIVSPSGSSTRLLVLLRASAKAKSTNAERRFACFVGSQAFCKTPHPRKDALVKRMSLFKLRFRGPHRVNIQTTGSLFSKSEVFSAELASDGLHRPEMFTEIGCTVRGEPLDWERISEFHGLSYQISTRH